MPRATKVVIIKYENGEITFSVPGGKPGSGDSVTIAPRDRVKWKAKKADLEPFSCFEVDFNVTGTPFPANPIQSGETPPGTGNHEGESGDAHAIGVYKYSVTLDPPSGPSIDPEVRVEDPVDTQYFYEALITAGADETALNCPDQTAYEGDLIRFVLDEETLHGGDLVVSFPKQEPVYPPTAQTRELRAARGTSATFYCQVRPVERERLSVPYLVKVDSLGRSGSGMISVLPRPTSASATV